MTTYYDTVNDIFKKYIGHHYDQNLYDHTFRVVNNAQKIADSLLLSPSDKKLAYLTAIVYELGKYKDKDTLTLLFEGHVIQNFSPDEQTNDIIRDIIYSYGKNIYSEYYSDTAKIQIKILNDADKLDHLYMDSITVNSSILTGIKVSANVLNCFVNKKECPSEFIKTPLDIVIARMSYIFSLNFKYSFYLVEQDRYIEKIITNLRLTDQITIDLFKQLKQIADSYITEKIGETYHGW